MPELDLQRYSGQWHEIAHLPMFFQRKCVANISATYTQRAVGTVGVRNGCDENDDCNPSWILNRCKYNLSFVSVFDPRKR